MSRLSPGGVAREAVTTFREHSAALLISAVIVFIPVGLADTLTHSLEELDPSGSGAGAAAGVAVAAFVLSATALLGDVFYAGVCTAAVQERHTGVRRELADVARELPYLRLTVVDLAFAVIVGVGLLVLIVPGVVLFTWFSLAAPVVEIEDRGVIAAFARSRELVRGHFWPVLGLLAPIVIVGGALGGLLLDAGPWILGDGFLGDWLGATLAEAASALVFALTAVVLTHQLMSAHESTLVR
jgi:hypothetical protein